MKRVPTYGTTEAIQPPEVKDNGRGTGGRDASRLVKSDKFDKSSLPLKKTVGENPSERLQGKSRTHTADLNSPSGRKPPFQCDKCDKTFSQRQSLKYHQISRHDGQRTGPCMYCSYKALDATKLRSHIKRVHQGFMPYKCKFCPKKFKCHSNHKEHEARHQGVGNFQCKVCNKRFAVISSLERHERYHSSHRPFVCTYCEKGFKAKPHLERHIKCIHLKEKNILCKMCGKAHFDNWNLKMHMRTHEITQERTVKTCNICNCKFKNNTGLAAHICKLHDMVSAYFGESKANASTTERESDKHTQSETFENLRINLTSDENQERSTDTSVSIVGQSSNENSQVKTIVIQDGDIDNDQCESKDEGSLTYTDFFENSSVCTFEFITCDTCSAVFHTKEEFAIHEHITS